MRSAGVIVAAVFALFVAFQIFTASLAEVRHQHSVPDLVRVLISGTVMVLALFLIVQIT